MTWLRIQKTHQIIPIPAISQEMYQIVFQKMQRIRTWTTLIVPRTRAQTAQTIVNPIAQEIADQTAQTTVTTVTTDQTITLITAPTAPATQIITLTITHPIVRTIWEKCHIMY